MTPRSIRRAAERKARKQAIKEARVEANRANSELSTGPRTPEGKAISSLNALKTGLTGRTVVLPSDDAAAYQQHVAAYEAEYKPVGLRECELVQSLADSRWRLNRIPKLEAAIYVQGRAEFAAGSDDPDNDEAAVSQRAEDSNNDEAAVSQRAEDSNKDEAAVSQRAEDSNKDEAAVSQRAEDSNNVQLQTYLQYEKQLKNLHLQEARLNRRFDKDLAELRKLQTQRKEQENGFEFSTAKTGADAKGGADDLVVCDPALRPYIPQINVPLPVAKRNQTEANEENNFSFCSTPV